MIYRIYEDAFDKSIIEANRIYRKADMLWCIKTIRLFMTNEINHVEPRQPHPVHYTELDCWIVYSVEKMKVFIISTVNPVLRFPILNCNIVKLAKVFDVKFTKTKVLLSVT